MYEKFAALLAKTNKTAYRVAKDTGISETAFNHWKNDRNNPSLGTLLKLAKYFDVPIDYFLEGKQ